MGEVIRLEERRRRRRTPVAEPAGPPPVEFLFDLASPFTYLAAERVDRAFAAVAWVPVSSRALRGGALVPADELDAVRELAEARAAQLRLPLAWPERWPAEVPEAMRVAHYAAERGRGAAFALRAARLAFGGGFDLGEPHMLAEAAVAAGLTMEEHEQARRDGRRDAAIQVAARRLLAARVHQLPALRVGSTVFAGEERVAEAAASARGQAAAASRA
jgi:2-hydroxychromene-2-carboxylate isomerase